MHLFGNNQYILYFLNYQSLENLFKKKYLNYKLILFCQIKLLTSLIYQNYRSLFKYYVICLI